MARDSRTEAGRALQVGRVVVALGKLRDELIAGGAIPADVALAVVDCADANQSFAMQEEVH